jgi:hypothetical protein
MSTIGEIRHLSVKAFPAAADARQTPVRLVDETPLEPTGRPDDVVVGRRTVSLIRSHR